MRLLNSLFEDENFMVDSESYGYIARDIINMNWWNTCDYLLGYQKNRRVILDIPTYKMKLIGIVLKEFYRWRQNNCKDSGKFFDEMKAYIETEKSPTRQLKLFSAQYRRNDSQYFYKNGKPTWLDCTSRATYAWMYVGQNGYYDFDEKIRVIDGDWISDFCKNHTVYPYKNELENIFKQGVNKVKSEIFSQKDYQRTIAEWVDFLKIDILPSRIFLFDKIAHVKTDPFKNNEKKLFKENLLMGNNELHYGFKTIATVQKKTSSASHASSASCASSASDASRASHASSASCASSASYASSASDASRASCASNASRASDASWFDVPKSIGKLDGLDHPTYFKKGKYGMAGHWKINRKILENFKGKNWFDPFSGHGESALYAKKNGINYVGIEINKDSMSEYLLPFIQKAVNNFGDPSVNVKIRLGDSAILQPDLIEKFHICYTSPPYFDFEDYGFHNKTILDCKTYDEFHERVTRPIFENVKKYLITGGVLAIQTEKNQKFKDLWIKTMESIGFEQVDETLTGLEKNKYSVMSKRDQNLLVFEK